MLNSRIPQIGDIWLDNNGYFLVVDTHELCDLDKQFGYLCELSILDLENGEITASWTVSPPVLKEMTFIA